MLPSQRTKRYLEKKGWLVASVEKYMKFPGMAFGRRIDTWGFGDLLACHPGDRLTPPTIALVQACAGGDHDRRRRKILGTTTDADLEAMTEKERVEIAAVAKKAAFWKKCQGKIFLVSWSKKGARGKRKLWTPRIETL
jgi:hypothetical protein